jgi:hypothetical protein
VSGPTTADEKRVKALEQELRKRTRSYVWRVLFSPSRGWNDFWHWEATLYVTSKSCFFLAGEGGGMTEFAPTYSDNSRTAGSRIIPMSAEEALCRAEQYLDTSIVEKWFTEPIQVA